MNDNQLFDDHIKDQLGGYSLPVNPRIWENIAAKRERRKPVGFWYTILHSRNILLITALLLAGGSGAIILVKQINRNSKTETAQTNTPSKQAVSPGQNKNEQGTETDNTRNNPVSETPQTNNAISINSPAVQQDQNLIADNNTPAFFPNNRSRKTAGRTAVNTTPGNLAENETNSETVLANELPVGGTLMSRLNYLGEKIEAAKKAKADMLLHLTPFGYQPGCPAMEKDASGNKKYIEFYAGPDYALRSLKDTGNSIYLQKRKESEKFTSAYSAGVRYTRVFNNAMSVRVGVNYSQINEKFTYKQGGLIQVTYIINANGDTTGSYITTGTRYKITHNKYRSVDIPLVVGYELGNGRLHANINAGAVINVYSWQKGEVLDTAYRPVNMTTGKGSPAYQFKSNAGVGFIGAVSIYYKLSDKLHIMVEPYYRHNFSQMNKDENLTIKQKYNTAGLKVGLRIDLR